MTTTSFFALLLASLLAISLRNKDEKIIGDTGFFHLRLTDNRAELLTPEGKSFFIRGVHGVRFVGDQMADGKESPYQQQVEKKYGSDRATWAHDATQRIKSWGFNTIGANSDGVTSAQGLPYVLLLDVSKTTAIRGVDMPDVFSQEWMASVEEKVKQITAQKIDDKNLIGYFTDNELHWAGDYKTKENLVQVYLTLPDGAPGRKKAEEYLRRNHLSASMRWEEGNDFQEEVARQYFKVTYDILKRYDPHHLVLGCRFASKSTYDPVIKGIGAHTDVVSWNTYFSSLPVNTLQNICSMTHLPLLISEFSYVAQDSHLPNNSHPTEVLVATQKERADKINAFVTAISQQPLAIGYIWFKYADNPPQGTSSAGGENFNWGLVGNNDDAWRAVTEEFRSLQTHTSY